METQISDSYRAMINKDGVPMIIVSDLESAFEPESVYVTQSGLNMTNDNQSIVIRNIDGELLKVLRDVKRVFLALTDVEDQQFSCEKTIKL
jgi:hypothetical protein